jgi:hypothetical protein
MAASKAVAGPARALALRPESDATKPLAQSSFAESDTRLPSR